MSFILRRFFPPSAQQSGTDHEALRSSILIKSCTSDTWEDDYEIIDHVDGDVFLLRNNRTIDTSTTATASVNRAAVRSNDSIQPVAKPASTSAIIEATAALPSSSYQKVSEKSVRTSASTDDNAFVDVYVRPLTYAEVVANGIQTLQQSANSGASAPANDALDAVLAGNSKMVALGRLNQRSKRNVSVRRSNVSEDCDDNYDFGADGLVNDRKYDRSRQRERALMHDRRARLRTVMV
ncbi:hypothetical protein V1511DRAFT_486174 [Dipodascopsis uninucleata]